MTHPIRWMPGWLLALALLLGGCASQAPLPVSAPTLALPLQLHVQRQQAEVQEDWLLVIQQEGAALRWSLLDPLGRPLSRQLLDQGQWHNDGLLPPNPAARELFAALLFALSPRAELARAYAGQDWQAEAEQRRFGPAAQPRWQVQYRQALQFSLELADGLVYRVAPLHTAGATP